MSPGEGFLEPPTQYPSKEITLQGAAGCRFGRLLPFPGLPPSEADSAPQCSWAHLSLPLGGPPCSFLLLSPLVAEEASSWAHPRF